MVSTEKFLFDTEFDVAGAVASVAEAKLLTGREIQDLRDSAFEAGVNEGVARETRTTEHRQSEALSTVAGRLGAIAEAQTEAMNQIIDQATTLTLAITRKISPALAQHQPLVGIEALVRDFLLRLIDEPHIVVRVPEKLIDDLKKLIDDIAAGCGFDGRVVLIPDPTMNGNDCRLEWADGGAVRNSETILDDIETGIVRMLENPAALIGDIPNDGPVEGQAQPTATLGSSQYLRNE